ncbi:unnamed protein product, partial [Meganyctiphanes norvegica]
MLGVMESSTESCGAGTGMGGGGCEEAAIATVGVHGGRAARRMASSGMGTPPLGRSGSPAPTAAPVAPGSREGSPLMLKRSLQHHPHHPHLQTQNSTPPPHPINHERFSLKRSNSLKRLLKLPIFGGGPTNTTQ